jgi:hypothetical protein
VVGGVDHLGDLGHRVEDRDLDALAQEQYGIDPTEITASVDATLIGNAVARCAEDASAALLRTLSERATPLTKSSTRAQQAAMAATAAAIFRDVASQYETRFKGLSGHSAFHAAPRTSS